MSVSNVSAVATNEYNTYQAAAKKAEEVKTETPKTDEAIAKESGVVYERSVEASPKDSAKTTYSPNMDLVNKLKADAEERTAQMRSLVEQLITGQGKAFGKAHSDDDIWSFLASGDFTVTEAAKKQAQEDISEDGYWGVKQTSERIIDFAKALTGGDPSKIDKMRKAFEKGFKEATKTWGKDLPDISNQTYDAVMKGFDDWAAQSNTNVAEKEVAGTN